MKTTAYIGLSGPFGYDFANPAPPVSNLDETSPNAVLENVSGLLVCYDEIVFLSRQFCPADMRHLPYVRFLTDNPSNLGPIQKIIASAEEHARRASEQSLGRLAQGEIREPSFPRFGVISDRMQGKGLSFAIDNHSHSLNLPGGIKVQGNSMITKNGYIDLACGVLIPNAAVNVIVPTPLREVLQSELPVELADGDIFGAVRATASANLIGAATPNLLQAHGSYHESLEDVRNHPRVREFRQYLKDLDAPLVDGQKLAHEIEKEALQWSSIATEKIAKGRPLYWSLGIPFIKHVGNFLAPYSGTAAGALISTVENGQNKALAKSLAWAPFVVDQKLRRM